MSLDQEKMVDEKRTFAKVSPPSSGLGTVHDGHMDEGLKILEDRGDRGNYVLEPAMYRRVRWKIDLHILPILT